MFVRNRLFQSKFEVSQSFGSRQGRTGKRSCVGNQLCNRLRCRWPTPRLFIGCHWDRHWYLQIRRLNMATSLLLSQTGDVSCFHCYSVWMYNEFMRLLQSAVIFFFSFSMSFMLLLIPSLEKRQKGKRNITFNSSVCYWTSKTSPSLTINPYQKVLNLASLSLKCLLHHFTNLAGLRTI